MQTKTFSLGDLSKIISLTDTDNDSVDFFYGEMDFLASGWNGQDCYISEETLMECADTVKGKFVTFKIQNFAQDFKSHEKDLQLMGYIDPSAEVHYRRLDDGRLMASVECVLSKIYCFDAFKIFHEEAYKSVSAEFSCNSHFNEDGKEIIDAFCIHSITVLGDGIRPAIENANIQIYKFSAEKMNEIYHIGKKNSLDEFAEEELNKGEDMAKKKLEEDVIMSESEVLAECSDVEEVKTESEEVEMGCDGDKLSDEVQLSEEEVETEDKKETEEKELSEDSEDKKDEQEEEPEQKEMSDDEKDDDDDEDEKDSDDKDDEDEEKDEPKKFSLNAYVDEAFLMEMLEKETEDNKAFVDRIIKEENLGDLISKALSMKKELDAFREEKRLAEVRQCEKKFAECMGEVKLTLDEDVYTKLFEEGKEIKDMESLDAFISKVKVCAYDSIKAKAEVNHEDSDVFVFAQNSMSNASFKKDDDVFNRIKNK
jgi:hypothetical protein